MTDFDAQPEPTPVPVPTPITPVRDGAHQGVRWRVARMPNGSPFVTLSGSDPYVFRTEPCAGWKVREVERLVEAELAAVAKRAVRKARAA